MSTKIAAKPARSVAKAHLWVIERKTPTGRWVPIQDATYLKRSMVVLLKNERVSRYERQP